jgi:hypothetical protein
VPRAAGGAAARDPTAPWYHRPMTLVDPERIGQRRIRVVALMVLGLCLVALALGRLAPLADDASAEHRGRLDLLLIYTGALILPGIGVALRPFWGPIVIWAMWVVPVSMIAVMVSLFGDGPGFLRDEPRWPDIALFALFVAIHVGIVVILPIVRAMHRRAWQRDRRVPAARVVVRKAP